MKNFITLIMVFTFYVTNAQTWTNYTSADGLIIGIISSLIHDDNGDIWFSDWTNDSSSGIGSFDGVNWTSYAVEDGAPSNSITNTFQDENGNYWFSTLDNQGVSRYDGAIWSNFTTSDGLVNNTIWSIFQDSTSDIWFLGLGISVYDGVNFINIETINGQQFSATGMVEDAEGIFWIATTIGLVKYDGVDFAIFGTADGFSTDSPSSIFIDSNNNIWLASYFNGLGIDKFDGTDITTYSFEDGIVNIDVRYSGCFDEDSNGNIYIGTNSGIAIFDGTNWSNIGLAQGIPNSNIRAVLINDDDTFWVGYFEGLSLYDPTLGINDFTIKEIDIYPNPTNSIINFESTYSSITKIELYDMLGNQIVYKEGDVITKLNISNQPKGIYIAVLHYDESNIVIKKIIKN